MRTAKEMKKLATKVNNIMPERLLEEALVEIEKCALDGEFEREFSGYAPFTVFVVKSLEDLGYNVVFAFNQNREYVMTVKWGEE